MEHVVSRVEQVHIGVAMRDKKVHSDPMLALMGYLEERGYLVTVLDDAYRKSTKVEDWPYFDALLTFFSEGMDFIQIRRYKEMNAPLEVNNVDRQFLLLDRRIVMEVLDRVGVPVQERVLYNATSTLDSSFYAPAPNRMHRKEVLSLLDRELKPFRIDMQELLVPSGNICTKKETLYVDGRAISKPYVEKPAYSENHNINIYYSSRCHGRKNGICYLFRKTGSKSSHLDKMPYGYSHRSDGLSYLYEKYIDIYGYLDIKAYVVGKKVYAETRKSPVKDGIVIRNKEGKEERTCIALSPQEVAAVRKTSRAFGQFICGMDILRTENAFYLVDVNGWSFVKTNSDYYKHNNLKTLDRHIRRKVLGPRKDAERKKDKELARLLLEQYKGAEIKSIHTIYRHGTRTPKMKKKLCFTSPALAQYTSGITPFAGRNTTRIKQIEKILEAERATAQKQASESGDTRASTEWSSNEKAFQALKGITSMNRDVRVKIYSTQDRTVKVVLKWGGSLTPQSHKEIEYEGMEYEEEVCRGMKSYRETPSMKEKTYLHPAEEAPEEKREPESVPRRVPGVTKKKRRNAPAAPSARTITVLANTEDRTISTAEGLLRVFRWTNPGTPPLKEYSISYASAKHDPDVHVCPELCKMYGAFKKIVEEDAREYKKNPASQKTSQKAAGIGQKTGADPEEEDLKDSMYRWQYVFGEYPELTNRNSKNVVPLILDFINYELVHSQEPGASLVQRNPEIVQPFFDLLYEHSRVLCSNRLDSFFRNNYYIEIVSFTSFLLSSEVNTVYVTKKLRILLMLKYILKIEGAQYDPRSKDRPYINPEAKKDLEDTMHNIGFLCSITITHFVHQEEEYLFFRYSKGISNTVSEARAPAPTKRLQRTARKKILALMKRRHFEYPKRS